MTASAAVTRPAVSAAAPAAATGPVVGAAGAVVAFTVAAAAICAAAWWKLNGHVLTTLRPCWDEYDPDNL